MSESEVWQDAVGYEGLYKVSNRGNIYSVERKDTLGRKNGGRILRPRIHSNGYLDVSLCKNGVVKRKMIHRLVLETFVPNPNGLPEVNHKDEVKSNNNVENLEWCTREYNANFGTARKRATQKTSKKVRAVNIETGEVINFSSTKDAMRKGYSSGNVSAACRGIHCGGNLYRGHQWSYEEENK